MQNPPAGPEDLTKARASDAQRRRATEALSYLIFSTGLVCRRVSDRCVQVPAGVTNGDNVPEKVTMLGASDTTSISIQPRAVAIRTARRLSRPSHNDCMFPSALDLR